MPGKTRQRRDVGPRAPRASMRPQRNAGENGVWRPSDGLLDRASMRPQRNAGENL